MIRSGLVSITFRDLSPGEIVRLVARSELDGVEWGGDVHVPHGDLGRAVEVYRMTVDAGLVVASYGSYYRVVASEAGGLPFERVLETAAALQAPVVRVWAGNRASKDADEAYRAEVVQETRRMAHLARAAGIDVAFEFHGGTLTDTNASTIALLREIDHPNVKTCWQPSVAASPDYCLDGLEGVLDWLSNVHVFHWTFPEGKVVRRPLAEGAEAWRQYLEVVSRQGEDRFAMIEFVMGDSPEQSLADARALKGWLAQVNERSHRDRVV